MLEIPSISNSRYEKPSFSIGILGFSFGILGISKICDNRIPVILVLFVVTSTLPFSSVELTQKGVFTRESNLDDKARLSIA